MKNILGILVVSAIAFLLAGGVYFFWVAYNEKFMMEKAVQQFKYQGSVHRDLGKKTIIK